MSANGHWNAPPVRSSAQETSIFSAQDFSQPKTVHLHEIIISRLAPAISCQDPSPCMLVIYIENKREESIPYFLLKKITWISGPQASLQSVWMLPQNGQYIPLWWASMISAAPYDSIQGHLTAHLFLSTVSSDETWGKTAAGWMRRWNMEWEQRWAQRAWGASKKGPVHRLQ